MTMKLWRYRIAGSPVWKAVYLFATKRKHARDELKKRVGLAHIAKMQRVDNEVFKARLSGVDDD